jgi:hypothetical protein
MRTDVNDFGHLPPDCHRKGSNFAAAFHKTDFNAALIAAAALLVIIAEQVAVDAWLSLLRDVKTNRGCFAEIGRFYFICRNSRRRCARSLRCCVCDISKVAKISLAIFAVCESPRP